MKTIFNFFLSFDKLMKEKLVKAFYWLSLVAIALGFITKVIDTILFDKIPFIGPSIDFLLSFLTLLILPILAIVTLRLLCETAIALFRINDNLSPDGGKGETADVDLIEEARKAAETAATKAREAAKTAGEKTRSAIDKTKDAASDLGDKAQSATSKTSESIKTATAQTKARATRTVDGKDITIEPPKTSTTTKKVAPKTTSKKTTATKSTAKKTTSKTASTKTTSGVRLNKDGTPSKKRGPKPKSKK